MNDARRRQTARLIAFALAAGLAAEPATANFNPRGRQPKKATPAKRSPAKSPARTPTKRSAPKLPSKPSSEALIKRYTAIVLNQPGAPFPIQRLAQLYRERDGNLNRLLAEFKSRVDGQSEANKQYNPLVALAGIYKQDGQYDQAIASYERAIEIDPKNPIALKAKAELHRERGEKSAARTLLERALPQLSNAADIEQALRALMTLSLELDDVPGARKFHKRLVKRAKGSFFVRAELGRELLSRDKLPEAEAEFREVVKAARGDNRALAPALKDLGRALSAQEKRTEALKTLRRALKLTGAQSGIRREILDLIVEVYRAEERLPELVALLEQERSQDFGRIRLLGGLYEETGRIDDAIKTYRLALKKKPKDLEVRLKLVQLLQIQGELDEAIGEYQALIRAAPHNPDFVFRLAEGLLQRGDRQGALVQLQRLERRSAGDDQTQAALVDFYERVGEPKRALALLEKLARSTSSDHLHLVELGNRYYDQGKVDQAKQLWRRILLIVPNRARALSILGEVYLEHDMPADALKALEEAARLEPNQVRYEKAVALALERIGASETKALKKQHYERARRIWEKLLGKADGDPRLAQEARQHIVTLWSLDGSMSARVAPLQRNLSRNPPDVKSGRLLAEIFLRMRRYRQAEAALLRVVEHAPGDIQSHVRLEQALVMQSKFAEAIEVLKKLVGLQPQRAREHYQRMAQHAAGIYQDDDAIRFATKAVELSPDDARGHQRLGDMHRRRQANEKAIQQYRKAIAKNDRLFPVYFDLSELLLGQGEAASADKLLRRVIRAAVDEDLIARAARLSMQINLSAGTLESLEQEMLPVALANPQRPIYRKLLVELYGALAFPLVQKLRGSNDEQSIAQAKAQLRRIGSRAVKPLLDALGDPREAQQRIAIELLTHLGNKNASAALFAFALGEAAPDLRVRAMVAAGAPTDPESVRRFEELLFANGQPRTDDGDPVNLAAVWGLCRLTSRKAIALQQALLSSGGESARALAAIALARAKVQRAKPELLNILRSPERGQASRAAAAFALGELGANDSVGLLLPLSQSNETSVRSAALVALARLGAATAAARIAEALIDQDDSLRSVALGAASVLASGDYQPKGSADALPEGRVDVNAILLGLQPDPSSATARAKAMSILSDDLAKAAQELVLYAPDASPTLVSSLLARAPKPGFGALTEDLEQATPEISHAAEQAASQLAEALVTPFVGLAEHPDLAIRLAALRFLAGRDEPKAQQALLTALADSERQVQRVALSSLKQKPLLAGVERLSALLDPAEPWPTRVMAAETLAAYKKLEGFVGSAAWTTVSRRLAELSAEADSPLVREAAVRALAKLAPDQAKPVLEQVINTDAEEQVRRTARSLLKPSVSNGP